MAGFSGFMDFFMPIAVYIFIGFIFYRIPPVEKGVDALMEKIKDWRERREESDSSDESFYQTIEYE